MPSMMFAFCVRLALLGRVGGVGVSPGEVQLMRAVLNDGSIARGKETGQDRMGGPPMMRNKARFAAGDMKSQGKVRMRAKRNDSTSQRGLDWGPHASDHSMAVSSDGKVDRTHEQTKPESIKIANSELVGRARISSRAALTQRGGKPHNEAATGQVLDEDDMVMVFSGKVDIGVEGNAFEQSNLPQGVRLEWLKPVRCNGDQCSECTPTGPSEACPYPKHADGVMGFDGELSWYMDKFSGDYDNYRLKLHVVCNNARAAHIRVRFVSGTAWTFLDGVSIIPERYTAPAIHGFWWHFHLSLSGGSHEIEIKFKPNTNSPPYPPEFLVGGFTMATAAGFVGCSEKKYCLHDITANTSSSLSDAYALAGSTANQLACLQGTLASNACTRWTNCLTSVSTPGAKRELEAVMEAGLQSSGPSLNTQTQNDKRAPACKKWCAKNSKPWSVKCAWPTMACAGCSGCQATQAVATPSSQTPCIDPGTENPEEWTCDCRNHWLTLCPDATSVTDIDSACLRQHWCATYGAHLCAGWKATFCTSSSSLLASSQPSASPPSLLDQVEKHTSKDVTGDGDSLLQRAGSSEQAELTVAEEQDQHLDASLKKKESVDC